METSQDDKRKYCSKHALKRGEERNIPMEAIDLALDYGRVCYVRGACYSILGRREIERLRRVHNIDASRYDGIHVVCSPGNFRVITVFRDSSLRCLNVGKTFKFHS